MQDRWYGDNRDIVKWATLVHLAQECRIEHVLQVAFYRQHDDTHVLCIDGRPNVPIASGVWRFFRDIRHAKGLERSTGIHIEVLYDPFGHPRDSYIETVKTHVERRRPHPLVVVLDPDTGIAPRSGGDLRHVRPFELAQIYGALQRTDVLVLYQHARQGVRDWLVRTKAEFTEAIGVNHSNVRAITCQGLAVDVAFFVTRR